MLGALLPWASLSAPNGQSFTLHSMDRARDGWFTTAVGFIVVGLVLIPPSRGPFLITGLAGSTALARAITNGIERRAIVDRAEDVSPAPATGEIAIGWIAARTRTARRHA